jgi:hypothetical protein
MKVKVKNLKDLKKTFNGVNDNPPYFYYTHEKIVGDLKKKINDLYDKEGNISIAYYIPYGLLDGEAIDRDCEFRLDKYNEDKNEATYYYNGIVG